MEVTVDSNDREGEIFDLLRRSIANVKRERLDVGDVRIESPSRIVLIERKTWDDLRNSISDGRKSEQQLRAMGAGGDKPVHFMYIIVASKIPGWDAKQQRGIPNANAFASLLKTQMRDNIVVHWASNAEDLAHTINWLYSRMRDNKLLISSHTRHVDAYVQQRKRKCADDNPLAQMLASVSGSSMAKAEAIVGKYPTMAQLVGASHHDISEIMAGRTRLGPALASKYHHILHGSPDVS